MFDKYKFRNLSLLGKVLLPYILLLLTVAMATSFGSSILLQGGLIDISKDHLIHIQQQAYNDFKNLERILTQNLNFNFSDKTTAEEIENSLFAFDQHIKVTLADLNDPELPLQYQQLIKKTLPLKTAYVSVLEDAQQGQSLTACQRISATKFLLIHRPLGATHLDRLANHYESNFYLLNQKGELLASNHGSSEYQPHLSKKNIALLLSGNQQSTILKSDGSQLITYSALPLGHDGIYLLATSQPLSGIEKLISNHRFYLLGIIGLSLLICITLFRSLLVRLFGPLHSLSQATTEIMHGHLDHRIDIDRRDHSQFVNLCTTFNQLMDLISDKDHKISDLSTQLETMESLKDHNTHLRKSNLELENRAINLKEQNQEFTALFKVTQTMVSSLDQQLLYERIMQALKESLSCSICVLFIFKSDTDNLIASKIQGIYGVDLKSITLELGEGNAGKAALSQKSHYLPDLSVTHVETCYGIESVTTGSLLSVPLTVQNRLIGVLNLHQKNINAFSVTSQKIAQAIANQAAIAIENARLYEKTKALSATDELTGLSNRRQFQEYLLRELAQSRRRHNTFSILMIDIDNFKLYNDYHGHLKGDIVLKKVASLLTQNTRGVDLVARFGGEEFVLLLPKSDKQNSLAVADKLRMCIEKEHFPGAESSQPGKRLTISIGVSYFPDDSSDIYDLMNLADTALYEAKNRGRNTCVGWNPELLTGNQDHEKGL